MTFVRWTQRKYTVKARQQHKQSIKFYWREMGNVKLSAKEFDWEIRLSSWTVFVRKTLLSRIILDGTNHNLTSWRNTVFLPCTDNLYVLHWFIEYCHIVTFIAAFVFYPNECDKMHVKACGHFHEKTQLNLLSLIICFTKAR